MIRVSASDNLTVFFYGGIHFALLFMSWFVLVQLLFFFSSSAFGGTCS